MSKRTVLLATLFLAPLSAGALGASADDYWPTWRGPQMNGKALKGNPPVTWSETENIKWKVKLPGKGSSSPIIWGDRIIFQTAVQTDKKVSSKTGSHKTTMATQPPGRRPGGMRPGGGRGRPGGGGMGGMLSRAPTTAFKFDIVCLSRETGKLLWQKTVREEKPHEGHHRDHGFASYSPVTDGKLIWASFGSRGLHCLDLDGNLKWSADLIKMQTRAGFGEGSSPALAGDAVITVADQEGDSFIFAFDKNTGKPLWKKARDERTSWATPLAVEVKGRIQVIVSATNLIRSYDAKTGDLIWKCGGQTDNVIPCPVTGFGKVFCASGYRGNALQAIELGRDGDLSGSDAIRWQVNEATPYVPSPLLYDDKLYICSGNKAVISCFDADSGKPHFTKQPLEGMRGIYASPVGAAGRVYFAGRGGKTTVLKQSEKLEILAVNTLDDGFEASPAIVGDALFLKGKEHLYCISK